ENLYKVEKYIHRSILKEKQNEEMSNELVIEVSRNLRNPVINIEKYISDFENINSIYKNIQFIKENSNKNEDCNKLVNNLKNEYIQNLNNLDIESNLLKHNIEELFELSKAITKTIELDITEVDIKSLLKQGLAEYSDKLKEANLKLKTNIDEKKLIINADAQQMWRVLEILLDNIVKYSKSNTRVYLNLNEDLLNKNIKISLTNISKEELNIDINEFLINIRKDTSISKMGLAIASNLISIQEGNLDIFIDGDMFKVEIIFKHKHENKS
ncbi:MAG: hypothetical protein RSE41_05585, partial [Clostridia bacterium]